MAPQLPHDMWVANRHFTSRCDFCDKKNTVLQHCIAKGCQIKICEPCMRAGVLAKDEKHAIGANQADCFEWHRKIFPRESNSSTAQSRTTERTDSRDVSSVHPVRHFSAPEMYGPRRFSSPASAQVLPGLPSLPMAFPHGSIYLGQAIPIPGSYQSLYDLAISAQRIAAFNPSAPHVQPPPSEPVVVRHKTSPKHVKKAPKHRAEEPRAEKAVKRKRSSDVAAKAPPEALAKPETQVAPVVPAAPEARPQTPEPLDESEEVIMASNILMAMSRGTYATNLFATPPISAAAAAARPQAFMTPTGNGRSSFLPTPGPETTPQPKPKSKKKRKQVVIQSPTPDEDIPWNPLQERIPITKAQWNERGNHDEQVELSTRALALRDTWKRITTMTLHQFGLDDDEELYTARSDQFRVAWERMMDCMPDQRVENRLNRGIAIAVVAEANVLLMEALAAWKKDG